MAIAIKRTYITMPEYHLLLGQDRVAECEVPPALLSKTSYSFKLLSSTY